MEIKEQLAKLLKQATMKAQEQNLLPRVALPEVFLERPQNLAHGDYASSLPLKLARSARMSPLAIAQIIVQCLTPTEVVARVTSAPPGFINFSIKTPWLVQQVEDILRAGEGFGNVDLGHDQRIQVEFVSINPTGPLHVGHGRGAILGSTLANLLTAAGYQVTKEYYINDAGSQMDAFYHSLWARYQQALGTVAQVPTEGYLGAYMVDLAGEIVAEEGDRFLNLPWDEAIQGLGAIGLRKMLQQIRDDLERIGVVFDLWFSERSLFEGGQYERAIALLREKGHLDEKEGALWFTSSALGEDKDNVVVRSNGLPTYFATDIAYHYNKFVERRFDRVINIWGADHQGHVSRMKAVIGALGLNPERLQLLITQMVTLKRGEVAIKVSKRTGELITLREVVDEVGPDACRFFFLSRSADSQMDFDLELAKKQSAENPVYYVQYAHARLASILRLAEERGIDYQDGDVSLLTSEPELALIREMLELPELVERAARNLEPHHLPHYAQDLATVFHSFYDLCRVISDDIPLTHARLKLVLAAKIVLARTLHLMGMTAPERM